MECTSAAAPLGLSAAAAKRRVVEPSKASMVAAKRQKAAASRTALGVTDWVTVHLNQTRQVNKNLASAPAIVSSVDQEKGTVNVLFPNRLSAFFHRCCPQTCVRFSIQTFPVSKVHRHESSSAELKPLLQHALASFAELREAAMRGGAEPCAEDAMRGAEGPRAEEKGVEEAEETSEPAVAIADTSVAIQGARSDVGVASGDLEPCAESDLARDVVLPCGGPKQDLSTARKQQQGDLGGFMRELSQLLREAASGSTAKAQVRDSLSSNYPAWDDYLVQLDGMNKVLLAEDAVFSLA